MTCYLGDVRDGLRSFIAAGVRAQTCVTSPPYWGLRDYGVAGQLGLEPTPAEFVANMVEVFGLVRDVLADDGTLWLNMGDSYATGTTSDRSPTATGKHGYWENPAVNKRINGREFGLKPKDLCGIPWRLAFALQADGWYLRSDIIWHKPNPMPESVTDRPTKAHEYLFLLSKQERYFYDQDAILEPVSAGTHARLAQNVQAQIGSERANGGAKTNGNMKAVARKAAETPRQDGERWNENGGRGFLPRVKDNDNFDSAMAIMPTARNKRTVWTIPTESFKGAHFATFPTALVEPCVLAGSRAGDIVLDPFMGSGTVAQVAQNFGRRWIGCELNPEYHAMQPDRVGPQRGMEFA